MSSFNYFFSCTFLSVPYFILFVSGNSELTMCDYEAPRRGLEDTTFLAYPFPPSLLNGVLVATRS